MDLKLLFLTWLAEKLLDMQIILFRDAWESCAILDVTNSFTFFNRSGRQRQIHNMNMHEGMFPSSS
jgi:hypothetical protein